MGRYICPIDGFQYSNRSSLLWHMGEKHPESDPQRLEDLPTGAVLGAMRAIPTPAYGDDTIEAPEPTGSEKDDEQEAEP